MRNLIIKIKINYWALKLWVLRKIGIVYDFERPLTKREPDGGKSGKI